MSRKRSRKRMKTKRRRMSVWERMEMRDATFGHDLGDSDRPDVDGDAGRAAYGDVSSTTRAVRHFSVS